MSPGDPLYDHIQTLLDLINVYYSGGSINFTPGQLATVAEQQKQNARQILVDLQNLDIGSTTSTNSNILIDCGTYLAPSENILIDCGTYI